MVTASQLLAPLQPSPGLRAGALCWGRSSLNTGVHRHSAPPHSFLGQTTRSRSRAFIYCLNLSASASATLDGLIIIKAEEAPAGLHLSCCCAASPALMIKCPLVVHISHVNLPFILPIVAALWKVSRPQTFTQMQKKIYIYFFFYFNSCLCCIQHDGLETSEMTAK